MFGDVRGQDVLEEDLLKSIQSEHLDILEAKGRRPHQSMASLACKGVDCHLNTQRNLVDAPHGLDPLLFAAQLRLPQELGSRGRFHLAVDQVQQAGQEQHQHRHGDAERPGPK